MGRHLARYFHESNIGFFSHSKNDSSLFLRPLGHVIYCAGYTADFRTKMLETVESHVCLLRDLIARADFTSLLYLSSTRLYQRSQSTQEEEILYVNPHEPGDLYNLSKLMGESLCLSVKRPHMRVVRLSNVFGEEMGRENFLGSLIYDALEKKEILLQTSLSSCKDYISIKDLPPLLTSIATKGRQRVYNVASGRNVSTQKIAEVLMQATGCTFKVDPNAIISAFPEISIERIKEEFGFSPILLENELPALISFLKQ